MDNNSRKQPMIFNRLNKNNIEAYTPKYAIDIIIPYLKKEWVIWAPFSREEHNFVSYLRNKGFIVRKTHYDPLTQIGDDFLTYKPDFHFDIILDNPPFKNKIKFIKKAISYNKPFALFLPLNSLGNISVPDLFIKNKREIELLIPRERTEFHNQKNNGISFKTVYICSGILPKQIIFANMKKVKLIRRMN